MKGIFLVASVLMSFAALSQDPEGFVLVKSDPPLEVHERWVDFPGKLPVVTTRELKSEFVVKAPIYKIIQVLKDESQVKSWHAHILKYKIYLKTDSTTWEEYSCHDIPWPLSDQDSFLEYKLHEIVPGSEYFITYKSKLDKRVPVYDNINRIELVGSWRFILTEPGVVKVIYRVQSASPTNVPRLIVDPVIRNNLLSSIKSLTEIVEK